MEPGDEEKFALCPTHLWTLEPPPPKLYFPLTMATRPPVLFNLKGANLLHSHFPSFA